MRKLLTLLFCTLCISLSAERMIADSMQNVDLLIEEKLSDGNHSYGEEFYVHNKNIVPILFTITIKGMINGKNNLIKHPMTIQPEKTVSVGTVEQLDHNKEGNWSWNWTVKVL